ncbi:hypothetical protein SAMN05216410_1060 [Sanguibacter gelidistatuariae]|uniref:Uncharacterized protein n=1 Tax=Sanguibacter gelidistatuariae TaxID=1814289 RepID=A0A1G6HHZ6_9MICO|nr:hypothetical protein SAMN05216410_1060 [Sanguibacter gelidistatuariae]
MTDSQSQYTSEQLSSRIRLPGVATGLFVVSPVLLLFGWQILMGTSSRRFFDGAPFQASLGTVMLLVGVASLLTALVLVGVRAVAQQQVDVLLQVERDRYAQAAGE